MKFLGDMNVSMDTIKWLKQEGYNATHLREQKLDKLEDIYIVEKAKEEDRIILTCDLDFAYLLSLSNQTLPSVILYRFEFQTPKNHINCPKGILSSIAPALEKGVIVSADDSKVWVRHLPIH